LLASEYLKKNLIKKKRITLLLSGGESVKLLYNQLFNLIKKDTKIEIFLTDERIVKNRLYLNENNLKNILIKSDFGEYNIFSLFNELKKKKKISTLIKHYNKKNFDFAFLGMGSDGHIASLFSDMDNFNTLSSLKEKRSLIITEKIGKPFCKRITVNLSLILSARKIFVIVKDKSRYNLLRFILKNKLFNYPVYKLLNYGRKKIKVIYNDKFLRIQKYLN
jgi:6-phosphogluconolactonase/glucosamine-6-phosphate isomerase/deaminase